MKLQMKVNPRTIIEVEGESTKGLFEKMAEAMLIFAHEQCGCCGKTDLTLQVRRPQGYVYYSIKCRNPECRAEFKFGQVRDTGELFPQLKNKEGQYKPNRGWERYQQQQGGSNDEHDQRQPGEETPF